MDLTIEIGQEQFIGRIEPIVKIPELSFVSDLVLTKIQEIINNEMRTRGASQ